jgi:hypothetical protein
MAQFKREARDDWLANGNDSWIVRHDGDIYPPKRVVHLATGVPRGRFHTEHAIAVFRELDFNDIVRKRRSAGADRVAIIRSAIFCISPVARSSRAAPNCRTGVRT